MYTFVMTEAKTLRTTIIEQVHENDNNINSFRFLIPQKFNGLDMKLFYVLLKYIAPDGQTKYMNVNYENSLYQNMLSIVIPITRKFTYKCGTLKVALGFISKENAFEKPPSCEDDLLWSEIGSVNSDDPSTDNPTNPEYLDVSFSTEYASIPIRRTEYQSGMSIINRFIQKVNHLGQVVPDNLRAYPDSMEMQLESKGKPIGDKVEVPCRGEVGGESEWSEINRHDGNSDLEWDRI